MGKRTARWAATMFIAAFLTTIVSAVIVQVSGTRVTAEGFGNLLLGWSAGAGLSVVVYILMELYGRVTAQRYLAHIDEIRRQRQERLRETEGHHE